MWQAGAPDEDGRSAFLNAFFDMGKNVSQTVEQMQINILCFCFAQGERIIGLKEFHWIQSE